MNVFQQRYRDPFDLLDLLRINLNSLILANSFGYKEIRGAAVNFKLYSDFSGVQSISDIDASLLKYLPDRTILRGLVLIPLTFGKAQFSFVFNHQTLIFIGV